MVNNMELSAFRKRLLKGEMHLANRELLMREYEYFASIAPKSFMDKYNIGIGRLKNMPGNQATVIVIVIALLIPLWMALLSLALPIFMVLFVVSKITNTSGGSPEYKNYDYRNRIVAPMLKLFDDRMELNYRYDPYDLVDNDKKIYYDDALVEAHMVMPFKKRSISRTSSMCSYDWTNAANTDSFEFIGHKIYYEWEDEDHDRHEEVFFSGGIYKFHLSFSINGTVNIMSTKTKKNLLGIEKEKNRFKGIKDKAVQIIDTENHEFAENFDTIATYDEEAYRFLTPAMIETLLRLRRDYFFAICIKGNVMTVTIDGGFRNATLSAINQDKPYFAPKEPRADLDSKIRSCGNAILSIYELKDILDPAGMYSRF